MKRLMDRGIFYGVTVCALAALVAIVPGDSAADVEEEDKFNYTVENNAVDARTREGYQIYTGTCMPCHGPDALGSSFAPSLIRAAERRTFADFARTVAEGRDILPGQVMPSFADDEYIMSNLDAIWNYLGARAEGGLGRGRPGLIGEEPPESN